MWKTHSENLPHQTASASAKTVFQTVLFSCNISQYVPQMETHCVHAFDSLLFLNSCQNHWRINHPTPKLSPIHSQSEPANVPLWFRNCFVKLNLVVATHVLCVVLWFSVWFPNAFQPLTGRCCKTLLPNPSLIIVKM